MHYLDARTAAARFTGAAYSMDIARARYRTEINPNRLSFRAWARKTYLPAACTSKLARVVARKAAT